MARGNRRRRELIRTLGLVGEAEGFSTKTLQLVHEKNLAAATKKPRRRKVTVVTTEETVTEE